MARMRGDKAALGGPGLPPRWATGRKDGVGTAYSADSRLWFTMADGIVTEVFFPTIGMPQLRDLQLLITDGETFLHSEKDDLATSGKRPSDHALGYEVRNADRAGRYSITKEVICDPHLPVLLQRVKLDGDAADLAGLRSYVLAAPHLGLRGWGNSGFVFEIAGRTVLVAEGAGPGWPSVPACRSPAPAAATWERTTAGLTFRTTSRWTGSSTRCLTATSR